MLDPIWIALAGWLAAFKLHDYFGPVSIMGAPLMHSEGQIGVLSWLHVSLFAL